MPREAERRQGKKEELQGSWGKGDKKNSEERRLMRVGFLKETNIFFVQTDRWVAVAGERKRGSLF